MVHLTPGLRLAERDRRRRHVGRLAVRGAAGLQGGPRPLPGLVTAARRRDGGRDRGEAALGHEEHQQRSVKKDKKVACIHLDVKPIALLPMCADIS